jgi:threonine/homoserine/homoserine lactone efflux protein
MTELSALLGIIAALTIGVISPGPSFVLVARVSAASSRAHGVATAFGMGVGGMVFAIAALLGLHGLFLAVPTLYIALKILGGLYLCYLGVRIFLSANSAAPKTESSASADSSGVWRAVVVGVTTQLSNPKTAIIYASVFAAFLPETYSLMFSIVLVLLVFLIELIWYGLVALTLSSARPRAIYLGYKTWVDRTAGVVMAALGIKLLLSASES